MRDHGKTAKDLGGLFGYAEKQLIKMAALGFVPNILKLCGCAELTQNPDCLISSLEARHHLLRLRIWPVGMPKNDKALDYS